MEKKPMDENLEKILLKATDEDLSRIIPSYITEINIPKVYIKKAIKYYLSLTDNYLLRDISYLRAASLCSEIGDTGSAIRYCKKGGASYRFCLSENPDAHSKLAGIYKAKGSIRKAIKHYKKAGNIHYAAEVAEINHIPNTAIKLYLEGDFIERAYKVAKDNKWDNEKIAKIIGCKA